MKKSIIDQVLYLNSLQENVEKSVDEFVSNNITEIVSEIIDNGGGDYDDSGEEEIYCINLSSNVNCKLNGESISISEVLYDEDESEVYVTCLENSDRIPFTDISSESQLDLINYLISEQGLW